jgi:DNA-binding protein HU-beta
MAVLTTPRPSLPTLRQGEQESDRAAAVVQKRELARLIALRSGLSEGQASAALEATLEEIGEQLAAGNQVQLRGFGKFSPMQRAARQGCHPQTGKRLLIASKWVPRFRPGAALSRLVG